MTITYIDLQKENLYGWEHRKLRQQIESYALAAAKGADFPPVPVQKVDDGYELLMNVFRPNTHGAPQRDGGHSRSLAHYIVGRPLKVEIVREPTSAIDPRYRKSIADIVLVETEADLWE